MRRLASVRCALRPLVSKPLVSKVAGTSGCLRDPRSGGDVANRPARRSSRSRVVVAQPRRAALRRSRREGSVNANVCWPPLFQRRAARAQRMPQSRHRHEGAASPSGASTATDTEVSVAASRRASAARRTCFQGAEVERGFIARRLIRNARRLIAGAAAVRLANVCGIGALLALRRCAEASVLLVASSGGACAQAKSLPSACPQPALSDGRQINPFSSAATHTHTLIGPDRP